MSKIIRAVFGAGQQSKTYPQWQYDYNTVLQFVGLDLPSTYEVDIANSTTGQSTTVLGDADGCVIPAQYFIPGTTIYVWVYITDNNSGYTRAQVSIPISPRAQRTGEEPTPSQQSALDAAIALLNGAADAIPETINSALSEAKASGEFDGPQGPAGPQGKKGDTGSTGPQGEDGESPIVTVTAIEGGHRVTIYDLAHPEGQSFDVMDGQGGSGGSGDYDDLTNKPQIGGVTLSGNKTAAQLGLAPAGAYVKPSDGIPASDLASGVIPTVPTKTSDLTNDSSFVNAAGAAAAAPIQSVNGKTGAVSLNASDVGAGTYSKPSGGIPKSDLASAVQTSLGKADTALQSVPSTYRTATAQDTIDAAQDTAIAGKLSATGDAYRAASIPMGELDSTSTATVMTAQVDGITELRDGVCVWLRNGVVASASGVTLNVNSLGAKPIYNSLSGAVVTTTFAAASTYLFVYNSTRIEGGCWDMVYGYDTNTTYTPVKLGFGYATCSTAEATTAKTAALSSYALTTGGIVAVKFTNAVPAGSTLNVNGKGAKAIYYRGAAITAGVIKAGDTVTMVYSTYYHIVAIIRADGIPASDLASEVQTSLGKANTALQQHQDISGKADKVVEITVATDGAVSQAVEAGKAYHFTGNLTALTITATTPGEGQYHLDFISGSTAPTVTLPGAWIMPTGWTVEANTRYEIDVLDGYAVGQGWEVTV